MRKSLFSLAKSKATQESLARGLAEASDDPVFKQLMHAIATSNRVLAEDCYREAGYILPQSEAVTSWLKQLLSDHSSDKDFPSDAVKALLEKL
nr:hypothetical protein [uncultured Sphaerochaeta sp.]